MQAPSPSFVVTVLPLIESLTKIAAVVGAGAWGYYQFFRGRTYRPRLELSVAGEVFNDSTGDYLIATARIKNVGLSKTEIDQRGTGLRISSCEAPDDEYGDPEWVVGRVFTVFEDHSYVEPGELIEDRCLAKLPASRLAAKLELRVVSGWNTWKTVGVIAIKSKSLPGGESNKLPGQITLRPVQLRNKLRAARG